MRLTAHLGEPAVGRPFLRRGKKLPQDPPAPPLRGHVRRRDAGVPLGEQQGRALDVRAAEDSDRLRTVLGKNQRLRSGHKLAGEQSLRASLRVRMHAMIQRVGRLLTEKREAQANDGLEIACPGAPDEKRASGVYAESPPM